LIWQVVTGTFSDVPGHPATDPMPDGHWLASALTIGAFSMILCAGLTLLGLSDRIDAWLLDWVSQMVPGPFPNVLGHALLWSVTVAIAFGLPLLLLATPMAWRRFVIAASVIISIGTWIPVLALAAYPPSISLPLIAAAWSATCAIIYATRHRMPCDVDASTSV
jgi:hypothetical protein